MNNDITINVIEKNLNSTLDEIIRLDSITTKIDTSLILKCIYPFGQPVDSSLSVDEKFELFITQLFYDEMKKLA